MPKFTVLIALWAASFSLAAQTQRAESLRPNVVAISAAGHQGFGFVTGSRYDKLFVVTAAHVIQQAAEAKASIELQFYDDYNRYSARVIRNYSPELDIDLLEVSKPEYFSWSSACLGQAGIGADVGFIGRTGGWYIPRGRALGTINQFERDQIVVDITSVTVGISGAPLIAESGIVGMIITADDVEVRAINLQQLRATLTNEYDYFFALTTAGNIDPNQVKDQQGNTYTTQVMKDGKRWMTQNLNLQVDNSWCYDDIPTNCTQYGRLYTWEVAKQACAELGDGWHLPTDEEWTNMVDQYGGARNGNTKDEGKAAYKALFGTGSGEFVALLGGYRDADASFLDLGAYGLYWSASERDGGDACFYSLFGDNQSLFQYSYDQRVGLSVRCLQD